MKRQGLLGLWIVIGAVLMIAVLVSQDSTSTTEVSDTTTPDTDAITTTEATTTSTTEATTTTTTEATTTTTTTQPPDERALPAAADELAAELSEAELMVRSDRSPAWGRRQQQLYRLLTVNREWAPDVLASVDDSVRPAVERNWEARLNLSALVSSGPLSPVLPAWRIRAPLPADELTSMYRDAEDLTGIPWEYLAAINLVETRMGRIEGQSTAGATGPMQFLPSTFAECCEGDPTVDRDAIIGAAVYLTQRGGPDDMERALRGYNNSSRYVNSVTAYTEVLQDDPDAYYGYHAWEVYFLSSAGLIRMPIGYDESEPVDAAEWISANPQFVIE